MRVSFLLKPLILCALVLTASSAFAELKSGEARKLIQRAGGSNLPGSSVRIKNITQANANTAEALAEIQTAFRLQVDRDGRWAVREVRIGPEQWEDISAIARGGTTNLKGNCDNRELRSGSEPSVRRARCLLAELMGVQLPSDAVRIKSVSLLSLPLSSMASALVVVNFDVSFRFTNSGKGGWRVSELRAGNRDWIDIDTAIGLENQTKRENAMRDLQAISTALQKFRAERGVYVVSDQQRILMDHLTPYYLARVIRVDPWRRPYQYQGERDHFTLRSGGPDGKANTPDDLVLSNP
jgi:Type II secretion system (T2SS), protein G